MKLFYWRKWATLFVLAVLLIIIYKTFDNFTIVLEWLTNLQSLLTPFFVGAIIAYLLFPLIRKLENVFRKSKSGRIKILKKYARGFSLMIVYLSSILFIFLFFFTLSPLLYRGLDDLIRTQIPIAYSSLLDFIGDNQYINFNRSDAERWITPENIFQWLGIDFTDSAIYAQGVRIVTDTFQTIFKAFIGIVVSIYILLDLESLSRGFRKISRTFTSRKVRRICGKYVRKVNEFIYRYLYFQLLDAVLVATLAFIGLSIIGVQNAIIFAFIIGVLNMIPYFGSIISSLTVIVFSFFSGGSTHGLIVSAFMLGLQQADMHIFTPRIIGSGLDIKPFWVILAVLVGGSYFGLIGMILAAPVAAVLKLIMNDIIDAKEKKRRNDKTMSM